MCDKLTDCNLDDIELKGVKIEEEIKIEDNINKEKIEEYVLEVQIQIIMEKFEDETNNYFRLL